MVLVIGILESQRISQGWSALNKPATEQIRDDYNPGELGFDPLGLLPTDAAAKAELQTKEINNGRLAMIAIAGFAVQEEVDHITIWRGVRVCFATSSSHWARARVCKRGGCTCVDPRQRTLGDLQARGATCSVSPMDQHTRSLLFANADAPSLLLRCLSWLRRRLCPRRRPTCCRTKRSAAGRPRGRAPCHGGMGAGPA